MSYLVYQLPGRVRIRTPHLVNNQLNMQRVVNILSHTPGVRSFTRNTVTGSITIRYDIESFSVASIVNAFRRLGFLEKVYGFPIEKRWNTGGGKLKMIRKSADVAKVARIDKSSKSLKRKAIAGIFMALFVEAAFYYCCKRSPKRRSLTGRSIEQNS